jgi:NAD(P)-dependent dehydrogenase (short-subunit alcohol dehydrogenase family)
MMHSSANSATRIFKWCNSILADLAFNVLHKDELSSILSSASRRPNEKRHGVITGALGGIGGELVKLLSDLRFDLSIVARPQKLKQLNEFAETCCKTLYGYHSALIVPLKVATCDLAIGGKSPSLEQLSDNLSALADTIKSQHPDGLDVIIHNAGLMLPTASERDIHAVNNLSPLSLSLMLIPSLMRSKCVDPSIVFVSSSSHLRAANYVSSSKTDIISMRAASGPSSKALAAYAEAKLHLLLSATALHKRFKSTGMVVKNVHPGLVDTPMLQGYFGAVQYPGRRCLLRSPREGASSVLLSVFQRRRVGGSNVGSSCADSLTREQTDDYRYLYEVNGYPAPRKCSDFVNDDRAVEHCFRDAIRQLPGTMKRKIARDARSTAKSLHINSLTSLAQFSPFSDQKESHVVDVATVLRNRREALLQLAKEMEAAL